MITIKLNDLLHTELVVKRIQAVRKAAWRQGEVSKIYVVVGSGSIVLEYETGKQAELDYQKLVRSIHGAIHTHDQEPSAVNPKYLVGIRETLNQLLVLLRGYTLICQYDNESLEQGYRQRAKEELREAL